MRLPTSLRGRLVLAAALTSAIAIVLATVVMAVTLDRFVRRQLDMRLDAQGANVLSRLGEGGRLRPAADPPPFDRPGSGWTWQLDAADDAPAPEGRPFRRAISRSLMGRPPLEVVEEAGRPPRGPAPPLRPAELGGENHDLVARTGVFDIGGRRLRLIVTAPPEAIGGPMREALLPLVLSMLALGLALVAAVFVQVRFGLQPLSRLASQLGAIRNGTAGELPLDQPDEVRPLAGELNALLDENRAGLDRARRHVANLAHGLKTPLADLALTLRAPGRDPDGEALALVADMDRRVRHHLGRARAAALGESARATTPLRPHVEDLLAALARIHAERGISATSIVPDDLALACEPQDLDEMVGNLLDNAFKWGRSRVEIAARKADDGRIEISIEDDGPGLEPGDAPQALTAGQRLDELVPGHGFGLSITRELAELYGGGLALRRSTLGGLLVRLVLPAAR